MPHKKILALNGKMMLNMFRKCANLLIYLKIRAFINNEATRERFLFWYEEYTPMNILDFIKRCIAYYGYKPFGIQTDIS